MSKLGQFSLKNPVKIAGQDVSKLELREPTTRDVRELGLPFNIKSDGTIDMNMVVLGKYIERLSDVMSADDLSISDFTSISMEIGNFLGAQMGQMQPPAAAS